MEQPVHSNCYTEIMDIITHCLALAPVPGLAAAFSVLRYLATSIQQVQASKQQLLGLATAIAQLMTTLNGEFAAKRLLPENSVEPLHDLQRLLNQISKFIQQQTSRSFLKSMYIKDQRIAQIDAYYWQIETLVNSFKISALLDIREWQARNDIARVKDQDELIIRLDDLEKNQHKLLNVLNAQQSNFMAIMASLQYHLRHPSLDERERQFYSSSLQHISVMSGSHVELESWMITSYDVDFGSVIGTGGFGEVFQGTWNKTPVALKVLKANGIAASSMAIRREVDTWSHIRHPHVLQFLGANVLDERPFIVMPYLKNGNARHYLQSRPECDRLPIIYHISLGIAHLHSINIVHGDLKAMNVLIDDGGKAVLCDFGLSRIKADVTSRTDTQKLAITPGSRNWMSPERLLGGLPRKPSDIYAFGMTIYEIYTNEIPLGHIEPGDFTQLVARDDVRPERPFEDEAPQMTDLLWNLAEQCWVKSFTSRPNANGVCDAISTFLNTVIRPKPVPDSPINARVSSTTPSYSPIELPLPSQPRHPHVSIVTPLSFIPSSPSQSLSRSLSPRPLPPIPLPSNPFLRIRGHTSSVLSVTFSSDGKRIASGSMDKILRVWDSQTGKAVIQTTIQAECVYSAHFSSDGKKIVTHGHRTISVWHADTGEIAAGPFLQNSEGWDPAFSPDGNQISFGSKDHMIHTIDASNGKPLYKPFRGHTAAVYSVAFSPDGKRIVSGSADKTIRVWNTLTRVEPFCEHTGAVYSVAFSPNGQRLVSGSQDKTVIVWDAGNGAVVLGPLDGHTDWVHSVAFSPDGLHIVSGSDDATIRVWDAKDGSLVVPPLTWHTECVISVAFSPDGERIVSGSDDKTICVGHWRDG